MTQTQTESQSGVAERTFIVRSADEAVKRVRDEMGPRAKVVSVRQVTGSGLKRFLATPRLEVVARPADEAIEYESPEPPVEQVSGIPVLTQGGRSAAALYGGSGGNGDGLLCREVLEKAGFGPALMARLEGHEAWRRIGTRPVSEGLSAAIAWLREYRETRRHAVAVPSRCAFVGGCGAGKTTSICKLLAREVFVRGNAPRVLRLEVDKPHLDDGLALYCEVLGVSCLRTPDEIDPEDPSPLYVDVPGVSLKNDAEHGRVAEALDALGVGDRVLVLNAAYDLSVLRAFCRMGDRLGAGFRAFTRLDELEHWGKLWEFVLDESRDTLFLSYGQNVAGDFSDDVFGLVMNRTFPG